MLYVVSGTYDLVKQHKTGFNAVQAYGDDPSVVKTHYIDTFCRTRCAVKYHLVYTDDGELRPLHPERAPSDIHEIIGYRLPDEIYYYVLSGMIGPQVYIVQSGHGAIQCASDNIVCYAGHQLLRVGRLD
jgi:hypothetical protein